MSVHSTHCCILHGCAYCDQYCPVTELKTEKQEYTCEICHDMGIISLNDLEEVMNNKRKLCPHCGHIMES